MTCPEQGRGDRSCDMEGRRSHGGFVGREPAARSVGWAGRGPSCGVSQAASPHHVLIGFRLLLVPCGSRPQASREVLGSVWGASPSDAAEKPQGVKPPAVCRCEVRWQLCELRGSPGSPGHPRSCRNEPGIRGAPQSPRFSSFPCA